MSDERKAWEQQEGEPEEAHARFLVYRNLGIGRTVDAAYQSVTKRKKTQASGAWTADSAKWNWKERAAGWDINNAKRIGESVVLLYIETLKAMWEKTLAAAMDTNTKPKGWEQLVETVTTLGAFIPQETVAGIRQSIEDSNRVPAIGTGGERKPDMASRS